MPMNRLAFLASWALLITLASACKCFIPPEEPAEQLILSQVPYEFVKVSDLPTQFDWRNINGTNYCSRVLTQQSPNVCGSCWAEAATGALSDRYAIATNNKLQVQLAPQQLLNFNKEISGGSCNGGSDLVAYKFIHTYGISDDTCAPFVGLNWLRGFEVASMRKVEEVQSHQCYTCNWDGTCSFEDKKNYNLYSADEFGRVLGVSQMKAEIFARGPIACSINSEPDVFDQYRGGIISCDENKEKLCAVKDTDHVVVIAGWGRDKVTGVEYWIGRNSYGSRWGEGAGGGWFRLKLGSDELGLESHHCSWATPAAEHVKRAISQYLDAL